MLIETKRNRPSGGTGAVTKPGKVSKGQSTHSTDTELDLTLLGGPNADIWAALFNGQFRLAVQCDVCGRWLTSGTSKAAGRGPSCAARAVR